MSMMAKCGYCRRWNCSCSRGVPEGGPDAEIASLLAENERLKARLKQACDLACAYDHSGDAEVEIEQLQAQWAAEDAGR